MVLRKRNRFVEQNKERERKEQGAEAQQTLEKVLAVTVAPRIDEKFRDHLPGNAHSGYVVLWSNSMCSRLAGKI